MACHLTSQTATKECMVLDERRGEEFDRVGAPALSRDGRHLAYRAQRGERSFVVVDGRRGPDAEFVVDPAISADGHVVAYAARRDGRWRLLVGERETELEGPPSGVILSPDGASVAWLMKTGSDGSSKVRVVLNGKAGEPFALVGRVTFSPDGRRVTYAADDGEKQYIVIGEEKREVSGRLGDPVFSPDGRRVGYGARIGRELWWKVLEAP
jgi:Tol biopolymer transport system component